mgnify:CR=1 FL=1|jgi:thioredoxin 1
MENFNEIISNSEKPVLVDFYAEWCGPCKTLAPVLDELKEKYDNQINILKINIDDNPELASKYDIRSIPTLMIFKRGENFQTMKGYMGKSKVEDLIKSSL